MMSLQQCHGECSIEKCGTGEIENNDEENLKNAPRAQGYCVFLD